MTKVDKLLRTINNKLWIVALVLLVTGQVLNFIFPYDNFIPLQLLMLLIMYISYRSLRYFISYFSKLEYGFDDDSSYKKIYYTTSHQLFTKKHFLLAITFSLLAIVEFNVLGLIPVNAIGIYIDSIVFITLTLSVFCYICLVMFIRLIYKISCGKLTRFNKLEPYNTRTLTEIRKYLNKSKLLFFITGLLYTVVYAIVTQSYNFDINTNYLSLEIYDIIFIFSWIVIIILIILAIPYLILSPNRFIKRIITNMQEVSSKELYYLYKANQKKLNEVSKFQLLFYYLNVNAFINKTNGTLRRNDTVQNIIVLTISLLVHISSGINAINTISTVFG